MRHRRIHSSPPFPYLITDALPGHIDGRAHDLGLGSHGGIGNIGHAESRGDGCPGIDGKAAASRCDAAFWMTIKRESCHEEKKRGEQEKCADKSYGGTSLRECIIPIQSWKESMMSSFIDDAVARMPANDLTMCPPTLRAQKVASIDRRRQVQETHEKALAEEAQSATATARLRKYMTVEFYFLA